MEISAILIRMGRWIATSATLEAPMLGPLKTHLSCLEGSSKPTELLTRTSKTTLNFHQTKKANRIEVVQKVEVLAVVLIQIDNQTNNLCMLSEGKSKNGYLRTRN